MELAKNYDPKQVEKRVFQEWENAGLFRCSPASGKKPFSVMIPPPNVTSVLHMGHALNVTLQDIVVRFKRMQGFDVLWQPGTDHAGIATQSVVERELAKEGTDRHTLGREKTVERIWQWVRHYGDRIIEQQRSLGCSCDWSRKKFTLDEDLSRAVRKTFVDWHKKGLIYRGTRLVNWDPKLQTALSDEEAPFEEAKGHLYRIRYKVKGTDQTITLATTRPETLFGDTAVAVNPNDERYKWLKGKSVLIPVINREIPVIEDDYVETGFGTGVVKITPAHDFNDYEVGARHKLPLILCMDKAAKMNEHAGPYQGLDRYECRKRLLKDLEELGQLEGTDNHTFQVRRSDRSKDIVEPYLSEQWFVRMNDPRHNLARPAIDAVKNGSVKFVPERWSAYYLQWMEGIRDWCISRQLIWGHRIPAWKCGDCGEYTVEETDPAHCGKCRSKNIAQDPDVLDTWFSSQLWPFSTQGWPDGADKATHLKRYYPSDTLFTDRGIIFFWVARMIMAGLDEMGGIPFRRVYIHGTILDAQGRKMSKSLGNGIDPVEMIDKYSADAVRFSLMMLTTEGQDVKLSEDKFEMGRNFTNKIWNAARFLLLSLEHGKDLGPSPTPARMEDRWVLSRLNTTIQRVSDHLEHCKFNEACSALYHFFWNDFCDWYIEISKGRLFNNSDKADLAAARQTLYHVLERSLCLLHPVIPFITEELWKTLQQFRGAPEKQHLMIHVWPQADASFVDPALEARMEALQTVVVALRNVRATHQIGEKEKLNAHVVQANPAAAQNLRDNAGLLKHIACLDNLVVETKLSTKQKCAVAVAGTSELYVPLEGLVDFEKAAARLKKEQQQKENGIKALQAKLANEKFLANADSDVVAKEKARLEQLNEELARVVAALKALGA